MSPQVDKENGIIHGVTVMESGVFAQGHFKWVDANGIDVEEGTKNARKIKLATDDRTIETVMDVLKTDGRARTRVNHSDMIQDRAGFSEAFSIDGKKLIQAYSDLGLNIVVAFNGVESGIYEVWSRLSSGRLKVFRSCQNWLKEFRLYRRDEKGQIVKQNDHLMDATRYGVMSGPEHAITKPAPKSNDEHRHLTSGSGTGWMGA